MGYSQNGPPKGQSWWDWSVVTHYGRLIKHLEMGSINKWNPLLMPLVIKTG